MNLTISSTREAPKRSIVKAVTWRVIGTVTLLTVVFLFTKQPVLAATISVIDLISGIILYYFHERAWNVSDWGRFFKEKTFKETPKRILAKTISWRATATLYLMVIILFLIGQPLISVKVAAVDTLLNIVEYYLHEYGWNQVEWGRPLSSPS